MEVIPNHGVLGLGPERPLSKVVVLIADFLSISIEAKSSNFINSLLLILSAIGNTYYICHVKI
jgi:hypothetical protein